jgi:hypothetical protein
VDLDAFMNDYIALLPKYGHSAEDAPPGARSIQLRMFYLPDVLPSRCSTFQMFYLPDEPAELEEPAKPAESGS